MAIAGPCFQIVNFIILNLLYQYQMLSLNQVNYYQMLNLQMCLFNLLPIYPLDGGRVLRAFCHKWLPYGLAQKVMYLLSSMVLGVLFVWQLQNPWIYIFVGIYSIYVFKESKELVHQQLQFYFYRFLHGVKGTQKVHLYPDLYRNHQNVIVSKNHRYTEKEWLQRFFIK